MNSSHKENILLHFMVLWKYTHLGSVPEDTPSYFLAIHKIIVVHIYYIHNNNSRNLNL